MVRLKVTIKDKEGEEGAVVYRPSSKSVLVSHPNGDIKKLVKEYLSTPRWFTEPIEDGDKLATHQRETEPTESLYYMYSALVEMGFQIGVSPVWKDIDNQLPQTEQMATDDDMAKGLYINLDKE